MTRLNYFLAATLCLLTLVPWLAAQDRGEAEDQLRRVRQEIDYLRRQLETEESTLKGELSNLQNLEKQATLQKKAMRILDSEVRKGKSSIIELEEQIDSLTTQVDTLKSVFRKQLLFNYKYRRGQSIEWILGAKSFNQALIRYRYFQDVSGAFQRLYDQLGTDKSALEILQAKQIGALEKQQKLLLAKRTEQQRLERNHKVRQAYVGEVAKNKSLLTKAIRDKQNSARELETLIASLMSRKGEEVLPPKVRIDWEQVSGNFSAQRSKLNWPIQGKVVKQFGKHKNPRLNTILVNNGIDIKAQKGSTVHCIFPGIASVITYMSGFGNTVIVDHNNGYYTVYAHLDEVLVEKFQIMTAGDVIGTVGDSGSLEGVMLHFEIYGDNKPLNPQLWLRK